MAIRGSKLEKSAARSSLVSTDAAVVLDTSVEVATDEDDGVVGALGNVSANAIPPPRNMTPSATGTRL